MSAVGRQKWLRRIEKQLSRESQQPPITAAKGAAAKDSAQNLITCSLAEPDGIMACKAKSCEQPSTSATAQACS